ncbi:molybdopterin molybdenumtransferase MoeA [Chitinophaga caeni]|uniref:Molybdopterin molybdenumtransferase n=1 Tax=Chitinophaga caeni TaxID=2029983 RepID=A0A291QYG8_9BACT|nr:molybdopterin molybdotransferase MoeA [Chitinophaga caeni]ATL48913.1 molybdopterin molybdenumtransferase MoeA [Chitinophaga caeni]
MNIITVQEAEKIILSNRQSYGTEVVHYENALGRVLAENITADRDLPPFNRATVDGIALQYEALTEGKLKFRLAGTQAAGEKPVTIPGIYECIEIMTGAAVDNAMDTVIRYEDILLKDGYAYIQIDLDKIKKGQNIHVKGKDKQRGDVLVHAGQVITPAILGIAASVGQINPGVKKLPRLTIISTGDEMVEPSTLPNPFQLRRSNSITIKSALEKYKINASVLHLKDDFNVINNELSRCLPGNDVLIISGGVSMGKFDYVPKALEALGVQKLFHKIKQRPGKPFWFGKNMDDKLVFAFPGNPVSVFLCLYRYFIPWLEQSLGMKATDPQYAILQNDINFKPPLQYFAQVKLQTNANAEHLARAVDTNGSGDFSQLADTNAFIELPLEKECFRKGEIYCVWKYA